MLNIFEPCDRSFQFHNVFNLDNENRAEDMPTLIDRKVCVLHVILDAYIILIFHGGGIFFSSYLSVTKLKLI